MSLHHAITEVNTNIQIGTTKQFLYHPRVFIGLWTICAGWTVEVRMTASELDIDASSLAFQAWYLSVRYLVPLVLALLCYSLLTA